MKSIDAAGFRMSTAFGLIGMLVMHEAVAGPWEVGGLGIDKTRKVKIEAALRDNGESKVWARPVLGYAHPVSERTSVEVTYGYGTIEHASYRSHGERDLDFKLKYQIATQSPDGLAWLFEPKLSVPVGDEASGVGRGKYVAELPIRAGRKTGRTTYTAELRYTHVFGASSTQQLVGVGGLVEFEPTERWVVGMDLFADVPTGGNQGVHSRANLAGKWRPNAAFEVQALVGRTLSNERGPSQTSYKLVLERKF